jgi:hypothetical protein
MASDEMCVRPKLPADEMIPGGFAHFMRDVVALIDEGDEVAWMESDDLLQCERAYGGLYDEANGRYGFAYFVDDDEDSDICWDFDLDRQQIRDIASGKVTQIQLWRCEPDCYRRFPRSDYYCAECDFSPE